MFSTSRRTFVLGAAASLASRPVLAQAARAFPPSYPASYADLVAAAKKEGRVAIYTSTDEAQGDPLVKAFGEAFPGITVDYNNLGTNGAYSRVVAEAAAKQVTADIVWTSAMDQLMTLVEKGYAEAYASAEKASLPAWGSYKDTLYATSVEPIGILYNKRLVPEAQVPRTRAALVRFLTDNKDRLKGKVASFDPEKSGAGFLFYTNDAENDPAVWDLVKAFGAVEGKVYPSSGAMREKVVSGEQVMAFNIIASYALEWAREDPNLGAAFTSDYTAAFSRLAFITKGAPHPAAAKLFLDFMLSKAGQTVVADKGVPSIRTDIDQGLDLDGVGKLVGTLKPIPVDDKLSVYMAPTKRAEFFRKWKAALRG